MPLRRRVRSRDGAILLTVLVVIALLAVGSASFFDWTFTEYKATRSFGRQTQARLAAESGVDVLRALLAEEPEDIQVAGGLYDNPGRFRGVILRDDALPALRCRVSVLAPLLDYGEYAGVRFGLENESSRLNLNTLLSLDETGDTAARDRLMSLPGMTEAIADAILDWLDTDIEVRPFGAETSYYTSLDPPYEPQNGPLESIDQLLRVRDVTPELLYGLDRNRDLVIDAAEAATELPAGVENIDGEMNRGWAAYLTLYSAERALTPEGEPKVNVNTDDLETLHRDISSVLGREEANFIVAYRQGGPAGDAAGQAAGAEFGGGGATQTVRAGDVQIDFNAPAAVTIDNLMRLVGASVEVVQAGENQQQTIEPLFPDEPGASATFLPELLDYLTVYEDEVAPGRMNVNQAPRSLLASIPGMPPEAVEAVIGARDFDPTETRPERRHATWLYSEGYLSLEEMTEVMPLVTGGGDVYRAQMIGFFDEEGPMQRMEVVIDDTADTPRVIYRQDLSPLGGGPTPAEIGAEVTPADASTAPPPM
ncbi:MAG: hypothetical protein AAGJ46_06415 [Planctomycetota bacterium]